MKPADPAPPPHLPPERALAALRDATRSRHDRLDQLLNLARLREPDHYARVLQVLAAFIVPWEDALAGALPADHAPWLRARSRRPFLRADLLALGLPSLPAPRPPVLASTAAAWGSLYVLEGSALGGQVITRVLADRGLDAGSGAAYFHGWGAATGSMWREFRQLLGAEVADDDGIAQACLGAIVTFDLLASCFEAHLGGGAFAHG